MSFLELAQAAVRRADARRELDQVIPPLATREAEARRQRLLTHLAARPQCKYVCESAKQRDGSYVIALASVGFTCELIVSPPRDPLEFAHELIEAVERHTRDRSDVSDKRSERK